VAKTNKRTLGRVRRQKRVRKKVLGTSARPRLAVFRSNSHIYAQAIDDGDVVNSSVTLASASSVEESVRSAANDQNKRTVAESVGKLIAERCKEKGISEVVFDRNGFVYHGRVQALAEGAREGGLKF